MRPQLEATKSAPSENSLPFVVDLSAAAERTTVTHKALQVFADYLYCTGIELSLVVSKKDQHDQRSLPDKRSLVDPCALADEPSRSPVVPGTQGRDVTVLFTSPSPTQYIYAGTVHQSDYLGLCQLLQHTQVLDEGSHLRWVFYRISGRIQQYALRAACVLHMPTYVLHACMCVFVCTYVCVYRQGQHRGRVRTLPVLPALKYSKR